MKTVADLLAELAFEIHDEPHDTWTEEDLLGYLNDAVRAVVTAKPDVYVKRQVAALTANQTRQTLPSDGIELAKIVRNMGSDGATPGRPIAFVDMDTVDALAPDWHTDRAVEIDNYMYDQRFGKDYYVYPGAHPSTPVYIEMFYFAYPPAMTDADNFVLEDVYIQAAKEYALYLLFSKELDDPTSAAKAKEHKAAFAGELGLKVSAEEAYKPN